MLNRYWRIFATGLSFTLFGLGGLLLPCFAVPVLYCLPGGASARERRAKALIHISFRVFVEIMRILGILTYSVPNREQLNRPGQLILANHPSLLDVVFLIAFIRRADCVVKSSLLNNPFMRGAINVAHFIANDNPETVVQLAAASLERGNSLVIFPEGTRTTPGEPISMRRGAANIALQAGCNITPVVISCQPVTLTKGRPWYQVPDKKFHIVLRLQPELCIAEYQREKSKPIAARKLTHFLQHYFTQELLVNE